MTLNDVLTRQNVFNKIILKDGEKELSKELKVKIMRIRMAYNKIRKNFDEEVKEFTETLIPDELRDIKNLENQSPEETERLQKLIDQVNSEYQEFLNQKGNEIINNINDSLTIDEYSEIVDINSSNDVEINGNSIPAINFLEIIYELFINENN